MKRQAFKIVYCGLLLSVFFAVATCARSAKPGKLRIVVSPKQAYTFVDGQAIGPGRRTIKLEVGSHHLVVANYGYKFAEKDVSIDSDHTTSLDIALEPAGAEVPGPRGRIQIEVGMRRAGDAAVLLNGKKPEYFVGHVDEFNNDIMSHQELVVPPGTHELTVTRYGKELWSGSVTVEPNQRVIVDISNGKQRTKPWPRGTDQLGPSVARFAAGTTTTTVAVAPVSGSVSANPSKIDCSQNTQLAWNSSETIDADMSGMSPVPTSGEKTISPRQTTVYELTATGPGGVAKANATVEVNPVVQSSLSASPTEVRYRRIGDKVIEQGATTLNWSSSNSDLASLDPLGRVDTSGTKSIALAPTRDGNGPVDEQFQYKLTATNVCGGSDTKTVAVRLQGSVEPIPDVLLQSVFFPTDYPTKQDPSLGLVRSQRESLTTLATGFRKFLEYDPDARLSVEAHADERGPDSYNNRLSELRAQSVKDFLISQGIASEKIDVSSNGKEKPIDKATVIDLQSRNPNQAPEERARNFRATWLAYNRRVDIILLPTKAESSRFYPNQVEESGVLWQRPKPPRSEVEQKD
jgi:outer membrane protein OmpA-like peptidoglycan-associated protein